MYRSRRLAILASAILAVTAGACPANDVQPLAPIHEFDAPAPTRGRIGLGFQSVHTQGSLDARGDLSAFQRSMETDIRSLTLSIDYRASERWSLHASLPYIRKRAVNDVGAHNPTRLAAPRPASEFLDDGYYHGTWQDWQFGVNYHTRLWGFDVRPHAVLTYPSRDYVFFASAATGQRLKRLRLGFDASRRLGRSNFHYSAGYSYELVEEVLGVHLDRHHLRASGRYDFSPQWSGNLFVVGRDAPGIDPSINLPAERVRGSELWYQHDRLLPHNYGLAGIGATWRIDDRWSISGSTSRMVWGNSIHDIKYAYEMQVSRGF